MKRLTPSLVVVAAALAISACGPKKVKDIPPPPGPPPAQVDPNAGANTGGQIVPGSRADFERSVTGTTVLFALDSSDIDPQARTILDSQATWLTRYPNVNITIEGHADERGTREYNLALGDRRANSAKNYLAARGISPSRISTISYGKERPVALGSDEESYAQNRRAVTIVLN